MRRTLFVVEDDGTDEDEPAPKVRYKTILQEELDYETEDDEVHGWSHPGDLAPVDWESRRFVEPWDPNEFIFFRIQ